METRVLLAIQAQLTDKYEDEQQMLFLMTATELNDAVKDNNLLPQIQNIQTIYNDKKVTLLVYGLKEFSCSHRNNAGRMTFEMALTEIQLLANVSHRLLDTAEEVGHTVMQFSKSVAEIPYK